MNIWGSFQAKGPGAAALPSRASIWRPSARKHSRHERFVALQTRFFRLCFIETNRFPKREVPHGPIGITAQRGTSSVRGQAPQPSFVKLPAHRVGLPG